MDAASESRDLDRTDLGLAEPSQILLPGANVTAHQRRLEAVRSEPLAQKQRVERRPSDVQARDDPGDPDRRRT